MTQQDQTRDGLLWAAALGQLDHDSPAVAARLARDSDLARKVGELERAHATAERVLQEGARLTEEAARAASPGDRERVLATLEGLARGDRTGHHRGRLFLVVGLAAAAALIVLALRLRPGTENRDGGWLGPEPEQILELVEAEGRFVGLSWRVPTRSGDRLELTLYTLHGDERGERILGPLQVAPEGWQPTSEQALGLPATWIAELERINGDDSSLVGRVPYSSPR